LEAAFKNLHIVGVSGGKDSTAMILRLREVEPHTRIIPVCTPTGDEPDEWFEHMNRVSDLIGMKIKPVVHPLGLNGLIDAEKCIPSWRMRFCTKKLKIEPFANYLASWAPCVSCVGLRADEEGREGGDYGHIPGVTMRFPLREWGWGVTEVYEYLAARGVTIPDRTDCDRCFFQTLYEWYLLWANKPAKYAHAEAQEARIGHTFRSPQRDTQPTGLRELREKFESGYVPKDRRRRDAMKGMQCRACTL
jgi:3'-phosphoadenosine 5'-phosphosulfate sulfotransferase (PAPS reductase)/FAD synthetase